MYHIYVYHGMYTTLKLVTCPLNYKLRGTCAHMYMYMYTTYHLYVYFIQYSFLLWVVCQNHQLDAI